MIDSRWAIVMGMMVTTTALAKEPGPVMPKVAERISEFVAAGEIAGAVTMVVDEKSVRHLNATGFADIDDKRPMREDSLFWIASMTKPVTAVAVMTLVEQGKLALDDPIDKYLPAMSGLTTPDGKKATITIQHLLSHTSGMAELGPEAYSEPTLKAVAARYAEVDVLFIPGSKWQYSQTSINTAARIVEVVSGKRYDDYLRDHIFAPLGMNDTTFYLSEEQLGRMATSYRKQDGKLEAVPVRILNGKSPTSRDRFPAANGGLYSTAKDYGRFCQMLLGSGTCDGVAVLKPESVKTLSTVVTGDLTTGFSPGNGWGIGVCVVREPQGVSAALSPSSYGHGGAYGTQAWIDPVRGTAYILMIQRSDLPNSDASDIRREFQNIARSSLESE